jgi:signal transduction histidine kinase
MLPVLVATVTDPGGIVKIISAVMLTLCVTAFALLWSVRRSMLDLWLLVVSLAWLLSSILVNLVGFRFDVAWYANRMFAIASECFVLFALLAESTMLYARLALSVVARQREREGRLMSMDAMSAAIAHEIKQPLTAIIMNANAGVRFLNREPPEIDQVREMYKHIVAGGHRASEVIESVRAMFGKGDQAGTLFDMNELIRETMALVRSEPETASIVVQLRPTRSFPCSPHIEANCSKSC